MTAKKHVESKLGFEEALERLEKIVALLERGDATLEDSLGHFEEGVALARQGHVILDAAEKRVDVLVQRGNAVVEAPLAPGGEPHGS